jgi:cytochrome c-type biogenesis protein CcmH/NrfF
MKPSPLASRRAFLRALVVASAAAPLAASSLAHAQMDRSGVLDIHNDEERRIFTDLQCTCGCPRESIVTCTCPTAAKFRGEVRAMMAEGMTQEQIKAEWVRRFGPGALMVPPNSGANRLLYLAPLVAIVAGAALVVSLLRRFRQRDQVKTAEAGAAGPGASSKRDDYDDKLDEELKQLDDR